MKPGYGLQHANLARAMARTVPANDVSRAPLKICLILEPLHAGVGRHVVDAACALSLRGHEVHILYSPARLNPRYLDELGRHPTIRCHSIPMARGICWADISAFRQVRDYVKANGPFDIVHGESSKGGGYARLLKLFGAKTVIYTPHAFVTLCPQTPLVKRLVFQAIELTLSRLTDAVVCSSQVEREHGVDMGIPPDKLALILIGREPARRRDRESVRAALGLGDEKIVIGFVGRMATQKAPERLIEAALRVMPALPQLHLLMIGEGPKRPVLAAQMRDAGLDGRVSWLGEVEAEDYMGAMDVFVLPSLYEGFAHVFVEALHAGLPIIATPVGGAQESILHGHNGMIVPHDRPDAMAGALRELGSGTPLRRAMAKASTERAALFSIARMADAIENLYYRKLDARRRAPWTISAARGKPSALPAGG